MIRGLIFDLDGVLVNTNPLHARAWQELAEELGIPLTPADHEAFLGISRAQCLEILLKKGNRSLSESGKGSAVHPEKCLNEKVCVFGCAK